MIERKNAKSMAPVSGKRIITLVISASRQKMRRGPGASPTSPGLSAPEGGEEKKDAGEG